MNEKETTQAIVLDQEVLTIIIPECCREGWETCEHIAKKPKKTRRNVGL